jgi:hypothetical protein
MATIRRWPSWMEVGVTGHNFESWPPKDHSCHVCFKLTNWFQRRRQIFLSETTKQLNCDFAGMIIGWSCTKLVNRLPIGNSRWPPWLDLVPFKDHSCHVCFKLAYWFQRKKNLNIFPIGSYVGHSFNIGPYGKYVLKSSPLKPVSQFKANMAWMVLKWSIFKIVSGDPDLLHAEYI